MARRKRPEASLRGYLNGVTELASLCSEWIGRSTVSVSVHAAETFPEAFLKDYRIRRSITFVESPETFKQTLVQWLGATPYHLCDHVVGIFEYELGKAKRVLRASDEKALIDDLSACEHGGYGAFYFTEDAFAVEFEDYTLVFLMGNNE